MRNRIAIVLSAVAALAMPLLAATLAHAADAVISAGPVFDAFRPYIEAGVSAAVVAALTWGGALLQRWTGVQIEARHRDALHSAAMTGVTKALAAAGDRLDDVSVVSRSAVLAEAVGWMTRSVPDAVNYFGLTPDKLQDIALAKLGQVLAGAARK